ncbi:MAG: sigma 54-interacting transcriptional regulator, partial [Myxococcales bacterium]
MRAADLDLNELLQFDSTSGIVRFAGQRALILDAVALGLLRRELIDTLGENGARGVLTRFGFAHGWRTAENLKDGFPWDDEGEWRRAGGRLHTLQGLVRLERVRRRDEDGPAPFAESVWHDSYEAEQHLLYFGQSDAPVCWTLAGFASGYLSRSNGREIYVFEEKCRAKGDAFCQIAGRFKEEWGPEKETELAFYRDPCLNASLRRVAEELKEAERRLKQRQRALARSELPSEDRAGIVARSGAMAGVLELATRAARVDTTVLITGESGAGKERIAQLIHAESARAAMPFLAINCAAMTESLLESELFGHARGAFTGASSDRAGLFEAAHGGTLFLDEVGEIPLSMQAKLLRVLQEREIRRVGENTSRSVDVRLVAATNRNLLDEVAQGRFRKDLYYRLRVIELRVPALRERKEDLLPLARVLLAAACERLGRRVYGFTPAAADQLL